MLKRDNWMIFKHCVNSERLKIAKNIAFHSLCCKMILFWPFSKTVLLSPCKAHISNFPALKKVASFLMQRKQLCSSSVFFPPLFFCSMVVLGRGACMCPYRVEKANFYGSATGIKLCVCWEKNGMEMLRQKIQLMPLLWNVLEGGAPLSFILFQINLPDFQCFFCFFCVSYWEMYWSYLENREREW